MSRRGDVGSARLCSVSSFLLILLLFFFFYSLFFFSPNVEVWAVSIWLKGLLDLFFFFLRPFCPSCSWPLLFFFLYMRYSQDLPFFLFFFLGFTHPSPPPAPALGTLFEAFNFVSWVILVREKRKRKEPKMKEANNRSVCPIFSSIFCPVERS